MTKREYPTASAEQDYVLTCLLSTLREETCGGVDFPNESLKPEVCGKPSSPKKGLVDRSKTYRSSDSRSGCYDAFALTLPVLLAPIGCR